LSIENERESRGILLLIYPIPNQ